MEAAVAAVQAAAVGGGGAALPDPGAVLRAAQGRAARWAHDLHAAFFPNPHEVTPGNFKNLGFSFFYR